jgi:hypothetical protein
MDTHAGGGTAPTGDKSWEVTALYYRGTNLIDYVQTQRSLIPGEMRFILPSEYNSLDRNICDQLFNEIQEVCQQQGGFTLVRSWSNNTTMRLRCNKFRRPCVCRFQFNAKFDSTLERWFIERGPGVRFHNGHHPLPTVGRASGMESANPNLSAQPTMYNDVRHAHMMAGAAAASSAGSPTIHERQIYGHRSQQQPNLRASDSSACALVLANAGFDAQGQPLSRNQSVGIDVNTASFVSPSSAYSTQRLKPDLSSAPDPYYEFKKEYKLQETEDRESRIQREQREILEQIQRNQRQQQQNQYQLQGKMGGNVDDGTDDRKPSFRSPSNDVNDPYFDSFDEFLRNDPSFQPRPIAVASHQPDIGLHGVGRTQPQQQQYQQERRPYQSAPSSMNQERGAYPSATPSMSDNRFAQPVPSHSAFDGGMSKDDIAGFSDLTREELIAQLAEQKRQYELLQREHMERQHLIREQEAEARARQQLQQQQKQQQAFRQTGPSVTFSRQDIVPQQAHSDFAPGEKSTRAEHSFLSVDSVGIRVEPQYKKVRPRNEHSLIEERNQELANDRFGNNPLPRQLNTANSAEDLSFELSHLSISQFDNEISGLNTSVLSTRRHSWKGLARTPPASTRDVQEAPAERPTPGLSSNDPISVDSFDRAADLITRNTMGSQDEVERELSQLTIEDGMWGANASSRGRPPQTSKGDGGYDQRQF